MDIHTMADKLWDMANLLTGFAVAQALTTTFAIAKEDFKPLKGHRAHATMLVVTVVFTGFYLYSIWLCGKAVIGLDKNIQGIWCAATRGRLVAVVLFTVVLLVAFGGHWSNDCAKRKALATDKRLHSNSDGTE